MWITLQCDASIVGVLCIYAPTIASERVWFRDQIVDVLPSVDSWIVGGDFNNVETFEVSRAAQTRALPHIARYAVSRRALACRVQGVESLQLRFHRRTCLTRASLSRPEDELSSKQVGRQYNLSSFREDTVDAIKSYPWEKLGLLFSQRVLGLVWIPTKWLAIPVFALSAISEFLYTLSTGKDIFIPLGILSGVLLATVIGNACLDVMKELPQDPKTSWLLILLGLFFLLLKLAGPYYVSWAAAFIPHMANAGLVKTALLFRDVPQHSVSS
ncbi:hypothetical protein L7F22_030823 [Adiantum nelumboides]|nr:hypothetical protein [Adiantum nelumboides]